MSLAQSDGWPGVSRERRGGVRLLVPLLLVLATGLMPAAGAQWLQVQIIPPFIRTYWGESFSLLLQTPVANGTPPYIFDWTYQCYAEPPIPLGEGDEGGGFTMTNGLTYGGGGDIFLTVLDSLGNQGGAAMGVVVGAPLELVRPLANATVREGKSVVFGPVETEYGLGQRTFEWFHQSAAAKEYVPITDTDGNPATLTINPVLFIHAGQYLVRVTDEGSTVTSARSEVSSTATLTINTSSLPAAGPAGLATLAACIALASYVLILRRPPARH